MRKIRVGVPSGKAKMVMWEGTEDEIVVSVIGVSSKEIDLLFED